ncbi:hypothetical protein QE152_g13193 [Popillia japonica]|uniref:Uncharacterized protein n=1 Tax=Popillia japonica TaxID=7064 RepID=A0AAW1LAT8_POPJA
MGNCNPHYLLNLELTASIKAETAAIKSPLEALDSTIKSESRSIRTLLRSLSSAIKTLRDPSSLEVVKPSLENVKPPEEVKKNVTYEYEHKNKDEKEEVEEEEKPYRETIKAYRDSHMKMIMRNPQSADELFADLRTLPKAYMDNYLKDKTNEFDLLYEGITKKRQLTPLSSDGNLDMDGKRIRMLADPIDNQDCVNKHYLMDVKKAIDVKINSVQSIILEQVELLYTDNFNNLKQHIDRVG